jgi:hypothetical protein
LPKIGANIPFEMQWSKAILGTMGRNWVWDVVGRAHMIDNRPGITGVKFQVFTRFGFPIYNKRIEPFLKARFKGSYNQNRVFEADVQELLEYNAYDSLFEDKIARQQMKELGYDENQMARHTKRRVPV